MNTLMPFLLYGAVGVVSSLTLALGLRWFDRHVTASIERHVTAALDEDFNEHVDQALAVVLPPRPRRPLDDAALRP